VALVTGASGGIGRGIARRLAEAGAAVAVHYRGGRDDAEALAAEIAGRGGKALAVPAELTEPAAVERAVQAITNALGPVDILVNNAARQTHSTIGDMSLAEWQAVIDIDLTGAWLASRAVIPHMDKAHSGNILMISSGAGRRGYPLRSPYAAAKWAMIGLTQTLAGEWGQRGIRVNCICPGAIESDRIERVMRARAESLGQPYEVVREGFLSGAALRRMATEEEVARVSLFIVSEAGSGVTGQTINVDCGSNMN